MALVKPIEQITKELDLNPTIANRLMTLSAAIDNRNTVEIDYGGVRKIIPCCIGISRTGDILLRAFQVKGASEGGKSEATWKMFRLDKLSYVTSLDETITKVPDGYKPGDKGMVSGILNQLEP